MDNRHYQAFANATTPPELSSLASEGYASSGSASENQLPTVPGAAWFHSVASELHNAILALGVTPDHLRINQLAEGILKLKDEVIPAGTVLAIATSNIPEGFLLCNGAAVSRTDYARLFEAIGTIYGAGDGSTTFNLPDARDRFIEGAGTHAVGTYLEAGLPNISGSAIPRAPVGDNARGATINGYSGCLTKAFSNQQVALASFNSFTPSTQDIGIIFNASNSSSIYGVSTTVQPSSLNLNVLIKY